MPAPLRVLIVGGSETDARLIARTLRKKWRKLATERVETAKAMRAALANGGWDAVLCDCGIPRFGAAKALEILKKSGRDIPFIVVSGVIDTEVAVGIMRAGAHDFVAMDDLSRLALSVERQLADAENRREGRRADEDRRRLAREQQLILDNTDAGIAFVRNREFQRYNRAFAEMFGYGEKELLGRSAEIVHPSRADFEHRGKIAYTIINKGEVYRDELTMRRKNGEMFLADVSLRALDPSHPDEGIIANLTDISERRLAEEALRKSEAQLAQAQRISHVGSWELDLVENVLTWSDEVYRIFDIDPEEFGSSYEAFLDTVHPEDRESVDRAYTESVKSGTPYEIAHRLLMKDGTVKWVNERCQTHYDDAGNPVRSVGTVQDITERERAENELRRERDRARRYLDIAGTIIVALDPAGNILLLNRAGHELLGHGPGALVGRNWFETALPEDQRKEVRAVHDEITAGRIEALERYENDVVTITGERRTVAWENSLLTDADGTITGTLSSGMDVTERREAEQALEMSEERIRLLLDSTADGIYGVDTDGICSFCNPAAARILGFGGPDEILGRHMHSLIHHTRADGTPYPADECRMHDAFRTEQTIHVDDEVFWRADGSSFPVEYSSRPIHSDGETVGAVASFRDITERKEAERNLRQVQRMESLGNLSGGIAHDINNMLLPILNLTKMVAETLPEDGSERKRLDMALQAAERIKGLVRKILAFSRREGADKSEVDIHAVVMEALDLLRPTLPSSIEIVTDLEDDAGRVFADAGQIETVIMNLASNAAAAMEGKVGELRVALSRVEVDGAMATSVPNLSVGAYATISVKDTGKGMDQATLEKAMEPFFTTKGVGKGTGLGLSMVHSIVTAHGGAVDIASALGEGTTVDVYLPLV